MTGRRKVVAVLATAVVLAATALVGGSAQAAPVLLSRNKPTLASSSGGCCAPPLAVDGNSATRWASGAGADPQWLRVDLGATASITRVRLQWDQSCGRNYRIETSPDGSSWSTIHTAANSDGGVDDLTVTGNGRYVRMFGTTRCRADSSHGYSLQELDVFGEMGGGGPDREAPTAPGAPERVAATANSVTIRWAPSSDNVGVSQYRVFRDGQQCALIDAPATQATCTNLNPNVTYGFYLNAGDAAGNVSPDSPTTRITTPGTGDREPPTAPGNLRVVGQPTSTTVTLQWNASTDNEAVTEYTIYDDDEQVGRAPGNSTRTTLNGLSPGDTLNLTATASDANGNESTRSNRLPVTLPGDGCGQPVCEATQVGTDNDVVWGLVTLPDGSILFSRRDAHNITRLVPGTGAKSNVGTVPNVQSTNGEGGLMGLELSPSFASDRLLYIMHTSGSDNRVVRMRLNPDNTLDQASHRILVSGIRRATFHNGGRIRFGPDGKLYVGTGDGQVPSSAQSRTSLNGKILRINPDGGIPADNPFGNAVWSLGHRNPQGLDFDSQGRLWQQEFGDGTMDETNLVRRGGNYGWPDCEGTRSRGGGGCGTAGFVAPKATHSPVSDFSCSGLTVIGNAVYIACQRGNRLLRFQISGENLTNRQTFFNGRFGRLRTVEPAPGGDMWMATSNQGDKDSTPNNSNNRIFRVDLR